MQILLRNITSARVKKINAEYFLTEIRASMKGEVKDKTIKMFKGTVEGWHDPPGFRHRLSSSARQISIEVQATGTKHQREKYAWVNYGTKAHIIRGVRFKTGYSPSTRPRSLKSKMYRRSGRTLGPMSVSHPGGEARHFDTQIAAKMKPELRRDIENSLRRAASRI